MCCDRHLENNPVTLKLKGDLHILKMYPHTENEVARSNQFGLKSTKIAFKVEGQSKMSETSNHF